MRVKQDNHLYEFGPFRLDTSECLLLRGAMRVPLTEKAFDTLVVLVSHSGHLVTKEELMAKVWADTSVEENNIDKSISVIRQALGEKASAPEYIETVRGRGYRFVARVSEVRNGDGQPSADGHLPARSTASELSEVSFGRVDTSFVPRPRLFKSLPLMLSVGIAVGLGVTAYFWYSKRAQPTPTAETTALPRSIAVLPFKPLVTDGRDESLELGMADSLITKLFSVREISVRPISAVRGYVSLNQDPVAAGKELGVEAVLEGSIQRVGERVRVTVHLVRIQDNKTLWADKFDEKFTDIFTVQDAISERVTQSLAARLSGEDERQLAKRYTENAAAYQLYVRGRYSVLTDARYTRLAYSDNLRIILL